MEITIDELKQGISCPYCGQQARLYKRTINESMARFLIWLVAEYTIRRDWIHISEAPEIQARRGGGDYSKLAYWNLIELKSNDDKKKKTSGYWRPTDTGINFAFCRVSVPRAVLVFDGQVYGFSEDRVKIRYCFGRRFDYREIMLTHNLEIAKPSPTVEAQQRLL
jgi:hypothetical protein